METTPRYLQKQLDLKLQMAQMVHEEESLVEQRKQQPYKIKVQNMPENEKYTKLDMEGKQFQNIIKMICYRAETAVCIWINSEIYSNQDEIRSVVKSIIKTRGDIISDYQQQTLTIKLYTQATPRNNHALSKLCELLTDTETLYPGTKLRIIYKLATN